MYEVIHYFTDLQDFNHPYNVGDIFPRDGLKVSVERLKELSGNKNKQNKPLIKKIELETNDISIPLSNSETNTEDEELKYTKTEINRMTTAELQELADKVGIENAFETSGGELKKILIEHYNL